MADRFCGNCGNELRPEDKFCPECGKPVQGTAPAPSPQRQGSQQPIAEARSSTVFGSGNQRVWVYDDRVVVRELARGATHEVRYEQMAGIRTEGGWFTTNLIIETRGGDKLVVKKLPGDKARVTASAIRERL